MEDADIASGGLGVARRRSLAVVWSSIGSQKYAAHTPKSSSRYPTSKQVWLGRCCGEAVIYVPPGGGVVNRVLCPGMKKVRNGLCDGASRQMGGLEIMDTQLPSLSKRYGGGEMGVAMKMGRASCGGVGCWVLGGECQLLR